MSTVTIAILAGGQSRRMGADKSFMLLHGKPIFAHVFDRVQALKLPTILITNSPEKYGDYALPTYRDVLPDCGSLGGLYTAIQVSTTEFTLCVACDMPFLNVTLLSHLLSLGADDWDIIAPRVAGYPETMHTVYRKTCLKPIHAQIERGNLKASGFFDQMRVRYVDEDTIRRFDPSLRSFVNVNTPEDLAAARDWEPD